jgi:hypothetical protein
MCDIYLLQLLRYFQLSYGRHNNTHKLKGKYYVLHIQFSIRIIVPKHLKKHYLHKNTVHIQMGRSHWSCRIRHGSAAARLLELWVQSRLGYKCLPFWVLCVVQVGVGLPPVQRSPTVRDVFTECGHEDPQGETMTRNRVEALQKKTQVCVTCSDVSTCCPKCVQPDP